MISTVTHKDLAEFGLISVQADKEENKGLNNQAPSNLCDDQKDPYSGDVKDDSPAPEGGYKAKGVEYPSPEFLLTLHNEAVRDGRVTLHGWQLTMSDELAESNKTAHAKSPYKLALCAANGSGKDAFVIAPFVVWFALVNVKALTIITSSSGTQLTSQTENYIRSLAQSVNEYYGTPIFRIRQRFIKCLLTGSEIRLFATDEAGKAEGYHPLEPGAMMAIIVNEAKSVSEEIFQALRRCTGYTHWLNVSTPGQPMGSFYRACCKWPNFRRVTSFDCSHLSEQDREEDKEELGEHSALYRSKHLALFTSLDGESLISLDVVTRLLQLHPPHTNQQAPERVGIDLAAGGDETALAFTKGNRLRKMTAFREVDTTITADRIEKILIDEGIPKDHDYIFADDGGIGHAIIDMLIRRGWNIKRVRNEAAALRPKQYGNRGAELWYTAKRVLEENLFNIDAAANDELFKEQLYTRQYKKSNTGGRIFLESKREAKADGRKSPDRADAFVLTFVGQTIDDYLNKVVEKAEEQTQEKQLTPAEIAQYVQDFRYGRLKEQEIKAENIYNSLTAAMKRN